jgi:thiamine transport system permease protein
MIRNRGSLLPFLAPAGPLLLFVGFPLLLFFARGAGDLPGLTADPSLGRIYQFTLLQAFLSALFSVAAALPGAWFLLRWRITGRSLIRSVSTLSFLLPPILVVLGFTLVFGRAGFINRGLQGIFGLTEPPLKILYSAGGIILAHVFYNFPVALRLLTDLFGSYPENELKAARSLGASPLRAFITVLLPSLWPGILSAFVLVFLYCFLSFAVVLVLGGGPSTATLEVELYRAVRFGFDPGRAASLILLEGSVTLPVLLLFLFLDRRSHHEFSPDRHNAPLESPPPAIKVLTTVYFVLFLLFFFLPLLAIPFHSLLVRSTRGGSALFSAAHYLSLFRSAEPLRALAVTLSAAVVSSLSAVALLFPAARISALNRGVMNGRILFSLPLGVSSLAVGTGLLYLKSLFPGTGNYLLLVAAHTALAIPLTWRILEPAARSLPASVIRAGEVYAPPLIRFFRVELPLLFPALVTALAFSFALSAGEVNAALLFSGPGLPTIPVTIYHLIGAYRFGEASALGTLLILVSFGALLVLERRDGRDRKIISR